MAYRIDRGEAQGYVKTEDGFLIVRGRATRCGVLRYRNPDGSYRHELRHPDDVINSHSLKTLAGIPLTIEHPPVLLNPQNVGQYQVGAISNKVEATDDGYVEVVINVHRGDAIDYLERGRKRMLSCGYRCDVAEEQGEYNGQRYTHRQRNIRYNHVCLTDDGRAGETVRVAMDSLSAEDAADVAAEDPPTVDHNWIYYGDSMGTQTLKMVTPAHDETMDMGDMPMGFKGRMVTHDGERRYKVTLDMGDYEEELDVDEEAFSAFKKTYDSMRSALTSMKKEGCRKDNLISELEGDLNSYARDIERKDNLISDLESELAELRQRVQEIEEHYDSQIAEIVATFDADYESGEWEGEEWEKDEDETEDDLALTLSLDMDDQWEGEEWEKDAEEEEMEEEEYDSSMEMEEEWEQDAEEEEMEMEEGEEEDLELRADSLLNRRFQVFKQFEEYLGAGERFDATVPEGEWLHRAVAKHFPLNGTESEAELRGMLRAVGTRTDSGFRQTQELESLLGITTRADSASTAREAMIRRELERTHAD